MLCAKCHSDYVDPPANLGQLLGTMTTHCPACNTGYRFSDRLKIAIPLATLTAEIIGLNVMQIAAVLGTPITLISFAAAVAALVYFTAMAIQKPLVPSETPGHPGLANALAVTAIVACFLYLLI